MIASWETFERNIEDIVETENGGFMVRYSCGHSGLWAVRPRGKTIFGCAQCVHNMIATYKEVERQIAEAESRTEMKLRKIKISPDLLAEWLIHPVPPGISSEAPADMKIMHSEWVDGYIELLVCSSTFNDPRDVLDPPPMWDLLFRREAPKPIAPELENG